MSNLIEENFFIIDSNNLEIINNRLYGFIISKNGILTNNYYKQIGYYEDPEPQGCYIMIRKNRYEIRIEQDFLGSFGLYIYENRDNKYFALSNSFLLLEEYLLDKQNITFNKDFADNLIISYLCSPSIHETLIKEIIKLPSNCFLIINIKNKNIKKSYIDYKENTIPFESEEGLKIIDKWVDKWGYIFRSLKKKTNNIYSDLSGGFDTRVTLSILLSSNVDLNDILIKSSKDKMHGHDEDFNIAKNIANKFGFKLNHFELDSNCTIWSVKDSLSSTIYTKLGFHKEFYLRDRFYTKPRFSITGAGGEILRGSPGYPIKQYIEIISSQGSGIKSHDKEFYNSSIRLCNRSVNMIKEQNVFKNDYEISSALYKNGRARNHFGKLALESFLINVYPLQPLIDPDIKKIKFDINGKTSHELIAYIYVRYAHDLINYPIQGNRTINIDSLKKAERLNKIRLPYKIKKDYNNNFYIDYKRKSPVSPANESINYNKYLMNLFNSSIFIKQINKIYDNFIYNWAKDYNEKTNYYSLRHEYGLLAIAMTAEFLSLNEKYIEKAIEKDIFTSGKKILNYLSK